MRRGWRIIVLVLCAVSLFVVTDTVKAQQPTPTDDEVNAVAQQLYCPVCENTPLDVCPTQACHDWRELIRQMLNEGKTSEEIKQRFVELYGERVLAEPPRLVLNWLVYVALTAIFLVGAFFLFRSFGTWRRLTKEPGGETGSGSRSATEERYKALLEEQLRKWDDEV